MVVITHSLLSNIQNFIQDGGAIWTWLTANKYGKPSSYPTIYAAVVLSLDESYSKIEEIKPLK